MDAFDASPAATYVEDALVRWLAREHGLGADGSGVMTMGGTASNLLGLLLARDRAGENVRRDGVPPNDWRIVASAASHDSIRRSAALLGLGTEAVIGVPTERSGALSVPALDEAIEGQHVIAFVGTAGTTDLGAIDPLDALADRAQERGAWFHVDAAVGSGLTLSPRQRPRLSGIERANSVTADLHKLWWQPFPASALLVPDVRILKAVHHASVYLNRPEDEAEGQLNLVGRSLDTSRRFDALKVLITLRALGRRRLGEMIDQCLELAQHAGRAIQARPELELLTPPSTVMVAFRHRGGDAANMRIHRELFASGRGRDRPHHGRRHRRAQAHAAEPAHDAAGRRRPARRDRQRGSLTGSLTARTSPAALRTRPMIQTDRSDPRGFVGSRSRTASTPRAEIERLTALPLSVPLEPRTRASRRTVSEQAWSQESRASARRRRSSRGAARAVRNGACATGGDAMGTGRGAAAGRRVTRIETRISSDSDTPLLTR